MKTFIFFTFYFFSAAEIVAQVTVTGTVYDASKKNQVENVVVKSSAGKLTITDSLGRYQIRVDENDSLVFIYLDKPTQKFVVSQITDPLHFDISLHVYVKSKYNTMKEVVVISKSYQQDSVENRELYADFYNFRKPTFQTNISPGGAVGADLDEIINMFRFKRNRQLKTLRNRLEKQEQDKYVAYRFNKKFVGRITHLKGDELDSFMIKYAPTYEFASTADEVTFNRYILNASYAFKFQPAATYKDKSGSKQGN